jgi:uncharacterized protein (TIRG00374 family)
VNRTLAALLGFLASAVLVGGLLAVSGVDRIGTALAGAEPGLFGVVILFGLAQIGCWGLSLRVVLGALDTHVSRRRGVVLYGVAMFANNVTPFGQAGGEPVTAYLINRVTETRYETSFAAIATVDAGHVVTSLALAVVGSVLSLDVVVASGRLVALARLTLGGLLVAVAVVGLGLRYRERVSHLVTSVAAVGVPWDDRDADSVLGRVARELRTRLAGFVDDLRRVGSDRRALALALGYSGAGWLCEVGALWMAIGAVGAGVPATVLLVVVPVGRLAGFAPLPGGFGSIEVALVGLLVATTPLDAGTATAAVLLQRVGTYWLPTVVGGLSAVGVGARAG